MLRAGPQAAGQATAGTWPAHRQSPPRVETGLWSQTLCDALSSLGSGVLDVAPGSALRTENHVESLAIDKHRACWQKSDISDTTGFFASRQQADGLESLERNPRCTPSWRGAVPGPAPLEPALLTRRVREPAFPAALPCAEAVAVGLRVPDIAEGQEPDRPSARATSPA